MFNDESIIIAGSGASIPFNDDLYKNNGCGLPEQLVPIIQNNYSIGLNYFFQYGCPSTLTTFVDASFYLGNTSWLNKVPLIIAKEDKKLTSKENLLTLPMGKHYMGEEAWHIKSKMCLQCRIKVPLNDKQIKCTVCKSHLHPCGFFHSHLSGIFSLSLAIALGFYTIYLLGYDGCSVNNKTHFYQNQIQDFGKFRGVGVINHPKGQAYRTSTYNSPKKMNTEWFAPFKDLKNVKIYNVSEQSVIDVFPKINYEEFYAHFINSKQIDQNQGRNLIKSYIVEKTTSLC